MEDPRTRKQPVGHQRVQVGVKSRYSPKVSMAMTMPGTPSGRPRLVRRNSIRHSWGDAAEVFEQIAVVALSRRTSPQLYEQFRKLVAGAMLKLLGLIPAAELSKLLHRTELVGEFDLAALRVVGLG